MAKNLILAFVSFLFLSLFPIGTLKAEEPDRNLPYPVELEVGEIFKVCLSGEIVCPARSPICDDLKVVEVVDTPDGMGFKGIARGSTLCSAMGGTSWGGGLGFRRVFRITVR